MPKTRADEQLTADAKRALRRLASAVSVVTCRADGRNYAMTASSVSALSMDPPSMLVCVNRSAGFHNALDRAEAFAINILSRSQVAVSRACSGVASGESRFRTGDWDISGAAPTLIGAQAAIVCRKEKETRYGTHTVFMGPILSVLAVGDVDPLVYLDGGYAARPLDGLVAIELSETWYLL